MLGPTSSQLDLRSGVGAWWFRSLNWKNGREALTGRTLCMETGEGSGTFGQVSRIRDR